MRKVEADNPSAPPGRLAPPVSFRALHVMRDSLAWLRSRL